MHQLQTGPFITALFMSQQISEMIKQCAKIVPPGEAYSFDLPSRMVKDLLRKMDTLCIVTKELEFAAADAAVRRSIELINAVAANGADPVTLEMPDSEKLARLLGELPSRLIDEINARLVLCIAQSKGRYYTPDNGTLFGKEVSDAFPLAEEDIAEAGKCFALGRYTATVFHLMRAMEVAVHRLAARLGATVTDKHDRFLQWGVLLSNIHSKIEGWPTGAQRDRWSEAHALLYHVKQAWRNDTMHPKQTYTEEQAKMVLDAVGSFMRHLAPLAEEAA